MDDKAIVVDTEACQLLTGAANLLGQGRGIWVSGDAVVEIIDNTPLVTQRQPLKLSTRTLLYFDDPTHSAAGLRFRSSLSSNSDPASPLRAECWAFRIAQPFLGNPDVVEILEPLDDRASMICSALCPVSRTISAMIQARRAE